MEWRAGKLGRSQLETTLAQSTGICYLKDFYFCPNPECEVVYYDEKTVFMFSEVKTKVFLKEKGSPRPLCYCKQVTEENVIGAVRKGAKSIEEVEEMTDIGNGGHCIITNPSGKCCRPFYIEFIKRTLKSVTSTGKV